MNRLQSFVRTSMLGGLTVILPVAAVIFILSWLYNLVTGMIRPLTNVLVAKEMQEFIASIVVVAVLVGFCFAVGVFVRTRLGGFLHRLIEDNLLKAAPGYTMIKEIVLQLFGGKRAPFSAVALVQLFGNDTLATAFVTDEHADGSYTVFVPTGPNPTSGFVYHLSKKYVHLINVSVEEAMRSVISCGGGSTKLVDAYRRRGK